MSPGEDFLRYSHESVFSWYKQADDKARVILGFTGVFLSILVGAFVADYSQLGLTAARLHGLGLALFVVAAICHLGAVGFSIAAIWSRGVFRSREANIVFFANIANYDSASAFEKAVREQAPQGLYVADVARNIFILSRNTRRKHRLVDAAAVSSGLALLATMWLVIILLNAST